MVRHHDEFLDKYYELRGWTREGVPIPAKLKELGLEFVAKDVAARQASQV
jgi:aldehyde:ferredoxin oxidoreductase